MEKEADIRIGAAETTLDAATSEPNDKARLANEGRFRRTVWIWFPKESGDGARDVKLGPLHDLGDEVPPKK